MISFHFFEVFIQFHYPAEVEVRLVLSSDAVVSHLHQTRPRKGEIVGLTILLVFSNVWIQVGRYLQVLGRFHVQPRDVLDHLVYLVHHGMLVCSEPGAERTERTRDHYWGQNGNTSCRQTARRARRADGNGAGRHWRVFSAHKNEGSIQREMFSSERDDRAPSDSDFTFVFMTSA